LEKPKDKFILDVCCGGKQFWFDKSHPNAIYLDKREGEYVFPGRQGQKFSVSPDYISDFKNIPYEDNSFKLVVFDSPHITNCKEDSIMGMMYGSLDEDWKNEISKGFKECFRVLEDKGILIFKWAESRIKAKEIIELAGVEPLFGHKTRRNGITIWMAFMKL